MRLGGYSIYGGAQERPPYKVTGDESGQVSLTLKIILRIFLRLGGCTPRVRLEATRGNLSIAKLCVFGSELFGMVEPYLEEVCKSRTARGLDGGRPIGLPEALE